MRKERKYLLSAWYPIAPTRYCNDTARHIMTNREFRTRKEVTAEKNRLRLTIPNIKFYLIEQITKVWID